MYALYERIGFQDDKSIMRVEASKMGNTSIYVMHRDFYNYVIISGNMIGELINKKDCVIKSITNERH